MASRLISWHFRRAASQSCRTGSGLSIVRQLVALHVLADDFAMDQVRRLGRRIAQKCFVPRVRCGMDVSLARLRPEWSCSCSCSCASPSAPICSPDGSPCADLCVVPRIPCTCIRQLGSMAVTYSAPCHSTLSHFDSPMATEMLANLVANVPPKPQHSSERSMSTSFKSFHAPQELQAAHCAASTRAVHGRTRDR